MKKLFLLLTCITATTGIQHLSADHVEYLKQNNTVALPILKKNNRATDHMIPKVNKHSYHTKLLVGGTILASSLLGILLVKKLNENNQIDTTQEEEKKEESLHTVKNLVETYPKIIKQSKFIQRYKNFKFTTDSKENNLTSNPLKELAEGIKNAATVSIEGSYKILTSLEQILRTKENERISILNKILQEEEPGYIYQLIISADYSLLPESLTQMLCSTLKNLVKNHLITQCKNSILKNEDNEGHLKFIDLYQRHFPAKNIVVHTTHHLQDANQSIISVKYSPDCTKIVTVLKNGTAKILDAKTYKEIATLEHNGPSDSIKFSPDNRIIATTSTSRNAVKIWNPETGKLIATLENNRPVDSIKFSPNNTMIVTTFRETVKIWKPETGELIKTLELNLSVDSIKFTAASIKFSPDNTMIFTIFDNTVDIWNTETGKKIATLEHEKEDKSIKHNEFLIRLTECSPDNKMIATTSSTTTKIWDIETGKLIAILQHEKEDKSTEYDEILIRSTEFSLDNKMIAVRSSNKTKIWDTETGKLIITLKPNHSVVSIKFSPNSKTIATMSPFETVTIWNTTTGKLIATLDHGKNSKDPYKRLYSVKFSPNNKMIATTSNKTVNIWNTGTGELIATLDHKNWDNNDAEHYTQWSTDNTLIVTEKRKSMKSTAKIWKSKEISGAQAIIYEAFKESGSDKLKVEKGSYIAQLINKINDMSPSALLIPIEEIDQPTTNEPTINIEEEKEK